MKYKIVIFDLDGTILDTLDDLAASTNAALEASGLKVRTRDEVRRFVGNGIRLLIERAVPSGTPVSTTDRVFEAFKAHYKQHCKDRTAPYEGVISLLNELRAKNIKAAVVSNKADFAVGELCRDYFPGLIDSAVGEREGIKRKPAPDSVLAVLRELGCEASDAVYVGDSDVDVETAANSGMECVSVTYGFRSREFLAEHGATTFADSVAELRELLLAE